MDMLMQTLELEIIKRDICEVRELIQRLDMSSEKFHALFRVEENTTENRFLAVSSILKKFSEKIHTLILQKLLRDSLGLRASLARGRCRSTSYMVKQRKECKKLQASEFAVKNPSKEGKKLDRHENTVGAQRGHGDYFATRGINWIFNPFKGGIQDAVVTFLLEVFCYPVVQYPDNHNLFLPISEQKRLGAMSPREFLTTVLHDLSLEERESLMVDEKHRRTTFLVNWPYENNLSGIKMAQAGFYCVDENDKVQCAFCRGSLYKWENQNDPMTEHAKMFAFCRFAKGLKCGNKEYRSDVLTADELKRVTFLCMPVEARTSAMSSSLNNEALGIFSWEPAIPKYASLGLRKSTYHPCPAFSPIVADYFSEAGFYYNGPDDDVRCFYCCGGIRDWSPQDDPWEKHAKWFSDCRYLIMCKGKAWVSEIAQQTKEENSSCHAQIEKKPDMMLDCKALDQIEVCIKLGHERELVDLAVRRNGKAFNQIKGLTEALYAMEEAQEEMGKTEGQLSSSARASSSKMNETSQSAADSLRPVVPPLDDPQSDSSNPIRPIGSCYRCFNWNQSTTDATQIALPCGHLTYCDRCAKAEKTTIARLSGYKSTCPAANCRSVVNALFHTAAN